MKKIFITLTVLGTVFLSSCEKDKSTFPAEKTLIKADKGILCRGCGDWDIVQPATSTEIITPRVANPIDSTSIKGKPIIPYRGNR